MANLNDLYTPTCETDCDDNTFLSVSEVCFGPATIEVSEIIAIWFSEADTANPGEPLNPITGWTNVGLAADPTLNDAAIIAWKATKDNTSANGLRYMKVIGDKPAPTSTSIVGPEGETAQINKKHTATFDIMTIDNLNYAFCQKIDGCGGKGHIWYETKDYLYGGINGVKMTLLGAPHILARGVGSIAINPLTTEWYAMTDPPRDANP